MRRWQKSAVKGNLSALLKCFSAKRPSVLPASAISTEFIEGVEYNLTEESMEINTTTKL